MKPRTLIGKTVRACVLAAAVLLAGRPAGAYVEAPYSLGRLINESKNILLVRVEKLDREKNLVIYRKVRDIKGTHPGEMVNHNIGKRGFHPREWQNIMKWAEVGKIALFFHNGGAGEMCIDNYWYQIYGGAWWSMSHGEPFLLRSFAGRPAKLATAVAAMLTGQEVVVPCMVDGDKNALQLRTARLQRLRASLKLVDYNPKRDFVGWGVEEYRAISEMPGFTHYAPVADVGPGARGVAVTDFDGDGKPDFCLFGPQKFTLLQNTGASFNEISLPMDTGARDAAWADYNGDGKCDLLLATPEGPRLFQNRGKSFRDATASLPYQNYYNLTAAAWVDYDGDKRPDILLADGFRGLRLYRNQGGKPEKPSVAKLGVWYYAGPFQYPIRGGFRAVYPPQQTVDLTKQYPGKPGQTAAWRQGRFRDGQVNNLALFGPTNTPNLAVFLYRELDLGGAVELPISLGSDDGLCVWLNGKLVLEQNVSRACQPDSAKLTLKLQPGRNRLLMRITSVTGDIAFYFAAAKPIPRARRMFEDVSDAVGLGAGGIAGTLRGDHLAVADVNGDKRPDVLYSAGTGVLALNTPKGFVQSKDSGITYAAGGVAPAFGDFNGDGHADLFVPQPAKSKLYRNDGKGHFADVTAPSGALAQPMGHATSAVWVDFNNRGRLDLLVGCFRGPNRYFRNEAGGKFTDAGDDLGLYRRIFNTSGLAVLDLNKDGVLDVVFNNEGQSSAVLLGDPDRLEAVAARNK